MGGGSKQRAKGSPFLGERPSFANEKKRDLSSMEEYRRYVNDRGICYLYYYCYNLGVYLSFLSAIEL